MTPQPDLLVIGGSGFLGRRLVKESAASASVAATHRAPPPSLPPELTVEWMHLDLDDEGAAGAALVEHLQPRLVVNAAYVASGPALRAVTALAPGALARACRSVGSRFVQISSDVVFAGTVERPYHEDDPVAPVHDYGRAKVDAERLVTAADASALVVRASLLWGADPSDRGPQAALARDPAVTFYTDEVRCPIEVGITARAVLELAAHPDAAGVIHVVGRHAVTRHELARFLVALDDGDPDTVRGGPGPRDRSRPRHLHLDATRAARLLGSPLPGMHDHPASSAV